MTLTVLVPDVLVVPDDPIDGVCYVTFDGTRPVPEEWSNADVLVGWGISDELLADAARRLTSLRLLQLFSAGSDNALRAGFAPDVVISNDRGLHDRPVAEHALALVLAAARRLHVAAQAQRHHHWSTELGGRQQEPSPGLFSTLRGARVVIWGFGSIGGTLAPHLEALGARVTGVGRTARQEQGITVVTHDALPDLLTVTDVLIMILPSTAQTHHVLDRDLLSRLPPHAWVVNVGRGDTVDEGALTVALREKRLGGVALDVTEVEPLPAQSPLWDDPRVILTPHAAGGRPLGGFDLLADNLRALQSGSAFRNVVLR